MKDLPDTILETILTYVYANDLNVDESNVRALLWWATYFQQDEISNQGCTFIRSLVTFENLFDHCVSNQTDFHELQYINVCKIFINRNICALSEQELFKQFHESVVVQILSSSELYVASEEEDFITVCNWIQYDFRIPSQHMYKLMKCICLPLLPIDYFI